MTTRLFIKLSDGRTISHWRRDQDYGDTEAQTVLAAECAALVNLEVVSFGVTDVEELFGSDGPLPESRHQSVDVTDGVVTFDTFKHKQYDARKAVTVKTEELSSHFVHAAKEIGLDDHALHYFHGLAQMKNLPGVFPLKWPVRDGSEEITIADVTEWDAFYGAAFLRVYTKRTEGTALIDAVDAAADEAAVDAVVAMNDART